MIQMDFTAFSFTYLFILLAITTEIQGLTLSPSRNPSGTLEIGNNQFTISCGYTKQSNEQVYSIELQRKRQGDPDYTTVVNIPGPGVDASINITYTDTDLESRTTASKPTDSSPTANLMFNDVLCSDKAQYRWKATYNDGQIKTETSTFAIDSLRSLSKFRDDGQVTFTPSSSIKEGDEVLFTCTGDVGNVRVGQLAWYMYRNGATSGGQNVSAQATSMVPVPNECTYTRTSKLNLTMTADMNNVVIRCTGQQFVFDEWGDKQDNYKQTAPIPVLYPPRNSAVRQEPFGSAYVEGLAELKLTCSVDSNPPSTYYWVLHNANNTEMEGAVLTMENLTEADSGTYTCVANNVINEQNNTLNKSVEILVQRTTTPAPTTSTTPTSGVTDDTGGSKTEPEDSDSNTTTIIIVVCVVAGVLVFIIVVVIIVFKKRKNNKDQIEEPPEKPIRNNQDMSYFSNRPDLVSADQGMKNNALNSSFNNSFDSSSDTKPRNEDGLNYVDLQFDDKPRSRRPIQIIDNGNMQYADIAMPRV